MLRGTLEETFQEPQPKVKEGEEIISIATEKSKKPTTMERIIAKSNVTEEKTMVRNRKRQENNK